MCYCIYRQAKQTKHIMLTNKEVTLCIFATFAATNKDHKEAISICQNLGVTPDEIKEALLDFEDFNADLFTIASYMNSK